MIHDVVVHFVTMASKPRVESVAALCDARLIYSLHGRYSHDRTSVMSPLIN